MAENTIAAGPVADYSAPADRAEAAKHPEAKLFGRRLTVIPDSKVQKYTPPKTGNSNQPSTASSQKPISERIVKATQPSPVLSADPSKTVALSTSAEKIAAHQLVTRATQTGVNQSPIDLDNNPFLKTEGKQLKRSKSQETPSRRRRSFGDVAKQVAQSKTISKAFGSQGLDKHVLIGMENVANYKNQGIPRSYLEGFQRVAEKENTIVAVRPVERICRTLIEEGYESKGLGIKGKSSNWGPMAGFIPVDQSLSKLTDSSPEKIAASNAKNHEALYVTHSATQEQLHISTRRIDELKELGLLENSKSITPADNYQKAEQFQSSSKGGVTKTFEAHQCSDGRWDIFAGTGDAREKLMVIPKTADFDLLFCFSPKESLDLATTDKKRAFDSKLGVLSDRTRTVIDSLNTEFNRGEGKDMVHHGADTENPVTDMDANFPCTVFFPTDISRSLGIYQESPILIKTEEELSRMFRAMRSAGFDVQANPLWDLLTDVVKEEFREKVAYYENKGNGKGRRHST
ncbi:hypothetical protein EOPP23_10525 [Endozoicomonas sp. OPT23]|uniref:anthrax toxin-like adenylyl cyclase domain-containing protein n=1 Tax=Endozoicomonas sp. OPT23 TaxID=2072845 RepID=UPI00129A3038|nr:anthrax toxin-like adenylyl cyclase domain-containing protein [Endozoicomonas sp. OPT23]MRI33420.1 hypothetical protein [Endozoicomonas sp. OPT23]